MQAENVRKIPRSTLKLRQRLETLEKSYSDLIFLELDLDGLLDLTTDVRE